MTAALFVVIGGLLAIAAATTVGPRIGIASPLLLVLVAISGCCWACSSPWSSRA